MSGRYRLVLAGLAVTALSACAAGGSEASAACAVPQSSLSQSAVAPGQPVAISGMYFAATCNDTGQGPAEPARGIPVVFRQGPTAVTLAEVDSSDTDYTVAIEVVVPQTAAPGPAELQLGWAAPMPLLIVPG